MQGPYTTILPDDSHSPSSRSGSRLIGFFIFETPSPDGRSAAPERHLSLFLIAILAAIAIGLPWWLSSLEFSGGEPVSEVELWREFPEECRAALNDEDTGNLYPCLNGGQP